MSKKGKIVLISSLILLGALIALIIVMSFIGTPKDMSGDINYEEYNEVIKEDKALVYYGESEKDMEDFTEKYGDVSVLNPNTLEDSEKKTLNLKDGYLYVYEKGKEVYNTKFSDINYKTIEEMMKKKYITGNYIEVTLDEYKELVKAKGYHVMFVGRETCSWCTKFKEAIKDANQDEVVIVYYIDTDKLTSGFDELYATDEYFESEEWGTPLTLIYKDGKRIDVINGYVESDELIDTLKKNKVL